MQTVQKLKPRRTRVYRLRRSHIVERIGWICKYGSAKNAYFATGTKASTIAESLNKRGFTVERIRSLHRSGLSPEQIYDAVKKHQSFVEPQQLELKPVKRTYKPRKRAGLFKRLRFFFTGKL